MGNFSFILYNKYDSKLRVFIADNALGDKNSVIVKISYIGDENIFFDGLYDGERYFVSALLSCNNSVAQPLSEMTEQYKVEIPTVYPNDGTGEDFFWVDIPVAYDPCVCLFQSNLYVEIELLEVSEISLTGTLTQTTTITQNNSQGNATAFASGITSTLFHTLGAIAVPNPASYALVAADIFKLVELLEDASVDANEKAQIKAFENIIKNIPIEGDTDKKIEDKTIKTFAAYADFFSATIAKNGSSTPKSATMTISTMELEGTSEKTTSQSGDEIRFSTPGSFDSKRNPEEFNLLNYDDYGSRRPEYTYYNEILGTFALLKKPKVEKNVSYKINDFNTSFNPPVYDFEEVTTYKIKKHPNNQIEYVFNPVAGVNMNKTSIFVAIEVNGINPVNSINLYKKASYITPFIPIERIANYPISFSHAFLLPNIPSVSIYSDDIYLKFLIEYEFTTIGSDGEPNRAIQIFKYPVEVVATEEPIPITEYELEDKTIDVGYYDSGDYTFSTFGDLTIEDGLYATNNSHITLNIGGNLILNGAGVLAEDGSSITINIAGNIINEGLVSMFQPNVSIHYNECPALPIDHEIPPITNVAYLQNFCETEYQAKYAKNPPETKSVATKNTKQKEVADFALIANPNPFTSSLKISYTLPEATHCQIEIYNIYGQLQTTLVNQNQQAGTHHTYANFSGLPVGVYMCRLTTASGTTTQKVVKQ